MWTPEHRRAADRSGLRYPSDLTDAEWSLVEPMIPPARHGGRRRSVNVRELLNARTRFRTLRGKSSPSSAMIRIMLRRLAATAP